MLLAFWPSFGLLAFLRLTRQCTPLAASISVLLSLAVVWLHFVHGRWLDPHGFHEPVDIYRWLSGAAWVTTLAGAGRRGGWISICLVYALATPAGLIGVLTGLALNLSLPRLKNRQMAENHGVYRLR